MENVYNKYESLLDSIQKYNIFLIKKHKATSNFGYLCFVFNLDKYNHRVIDRVLTLRIS